MPPNPNPNPNPTPAADPCRVYIACLASYNAGHLVGEWLDVPDDPEELAAAVAGLLERSPEPGAEEWAAHDYDGPLGPLASLLGESPNLADLCTLARLIGDHGPPVARLFGVLGGDLARTMAAVEDGRLRGPYPNLEDYAMEYTELAHPAELPAWLADHVDWLAMGRSLTAALVAFRDGDGGLYVVEEG